MFNKDIDNIITITEAKLNKANRWPGKYFVRAIITGFYVIVAIILSYTTGAILSDKYPEISKIIVAATFSFALALIVFLSGELFTGNTFALSVGIQKRKVKIKDAVKVLIFSYLGNMLGSILLAYLFVKSEPSLIKDYIEPIVIAKVNLSVANMFIRGILCNFIVCLGYLTGIKMTSESGKMIMMFFCVFAFVIAGFEHSIANMGIFSIGYFALGSLSLYSVLKNLFFVTIGNIIGGGILLAIPSVYMSID